MAHSFGLDDAAAGAHFHQTVSLLVRALPDDLVVGSEVILEVCWPCIGSDARLRRMDGR